MVAFAWSNSPWADHYFSLRGLELGAFTLRMDLLHWFCMHQSGVHAVTAGLAGLPDRVSWRQVAGVGLLAGPDVEAEPTRP